VTVLAVEHGTPAAYRRCQDGTGGACEACKKANAAQVARARKGPPKRVPAGQVRDQIADLRAQGFSLADIAALADVSVTTIRDIAAGDQDRCSRRTRRQILGLIAPSGTHISVVPDVEADEERSFDDPVAGLRLLLLASELEWKQRAECARLDIAIPDRHDLFFPRRGESPGPAIAICSRCPVWQACISLALATSAEGVWGRTSGAARRRIVHHGITVEQLAAVGMADDQTLSVTVAIDRVLALEIQQ
jgi:hypothetical protein